MKKQYLLLLPIILLLFACRGKQTVGANDEAYLDSLSNQCYSLVLELQTDTLRMVAKKYIAATTPYSKPYFDARQYYINSYFNAREYDKVLSLLDETEQMPHFVDYPVITCNYQYTRARLYQFTRRYDEAIDAFKHCLEYDTQDEKEQDELLPIILGSMTQLMNVCALTGKQEEGYQYFLSLKNQPTGLVSRCAMRDLYAHLAYIANQSGHAAEAYRMADSIFVLPLYKSSPEKLFRDYSYSASVFYNHPDKKEYVVQLLQQAMQEAEKYTNMAGVQWSMNLLAYHYRVSGKVEEGTELQYKALEISKQREDKGAECTAYINLSALYLDWELNQQANEYADFALKTILPTDKHSFQGEAFETKAKVMKEMNQQDSAIYYYYRADSCYLLSGMEVAGMEAKASIARLMIDNYEGDSLALGVNVLRELLNTSDKNRGKSYNFFYLGKGLIKQGHLSAGEAMLDSMYCEVLRVKNRMFARGVLEFIIDYYLSQGNAGKVMQYAAFYRHDMDIRYDENISQKVTAAMIKYQTEQKEQQLKLAVAELSVKNLRIKYYSVLVIGLLLLLAGGILWYIHQRKLHRARQLLAEKEKLVALRECELSELRLHEQEQQLANALDTLREANYQSEQLEEQLTHYLSARKNQQNVISLMPSVFREEGEVKFRSYFSRLYPSFLSTLKERVPNITRSEEILCMLIALGQNMEEIANVLCIEKKSVKMSRYRLRKKMEIEQDESMDQWINTIIIR